MLQNTILSQVRNDWDKKEISAIYHTPLLSLTYQASSIHAQYHTIGEVQTCTLLSIKTGGCSEDCAYCPQSARYKTSVERTPMMALKDILMAARDAKENGSTRFCMGTAWRNIRKSNDFKNILKAIKQITDMNMEVCCTLGMLDDEQAQLLKQAGLYAYNHNLDSSENFYKTIITTRTYQDRLDTLKKVDNQGISICCGGIIGMGETHDDRIELLHTLATLPNHPGSVPINALLPVKGTPLENQPPLPFQDIVRMIATARIIMPKSMVRLSAGRVNLSMETQALCFMAGANSIFTGEKLLTTDNNTVDNDKIMFEILGLTPRKAFKKEKSKEILQEMRTVS